MSKVYYAIGDVHGMYPQLLDLHMAISDDVEANKYDDVVIVHLGDYVDRGPESKEVLHYLMKMEKSVEDKAVKVVNLLGNHEDLMLKAHDDATPSNVNLWMINGGTKTVDSFGVQSHFDIPKEYFDFLRHMPTKHMDFDNKLFFVHAGVHITEFPHLTREVAIWSRYASFFNDQFWGASGNWAELKGWMFVHGHTPHTAVPEITNRRINTDTGACFTDMNRLTAVKIVTSPDDRKISYMQTDDKLTRYGDFKTVQEYAREY